VTQDPRRIVRPASAGPEHTRAVTWTVHAQVLVATVVGELTFSTARAMSREMERRLTPDVGRVVLDLSGVAAGLDAVLLAGLLSVRTTLRRRAGQLTIVADGERLDRLVRVSALDDLLTIAPSLEDALGPSELAASTRATAQDEGVAA
jgi:anti-anti-sigma factor